MRATCLQCMRMKNSYKYPLHVGTSTFKLLWLVLGGWDHWYARLCFLHAIPNSMQSLHDLSHLEIIFQKAQSHISMVLFVAKISGEVEYMLLISTIHNRPNSSGLTWWNRWRQNSSPKSRVMRWLVVKVPEHWLWTPDPAAADVAAPLTEWAAKMDTSTPASFSVSQSQRAIVQETTGLCGLTIATNSLVESLGLNSVVAVTYCRSASTGHKFVLCGKDGKKNSLGVLPWEDCFSQWWWQKFYSFWLVTAPTQLERG